MRKKENRNPMTNFLENACTFKSANRDRNGDEMKRNVGGKNGVHIIQPNIYSVVECTSTFAVLMFQSEQLG